MGNPRDFTKRIVPWVTYTDPEIAHVGAYERDLEGKGGCDTYTNPVQHNDRAICEGRRKGFVRIHVEKGSDKLLGATIVGPNAGEQISMFTLAIQNGIGANAVGEMIVP